MEFGIFLMLIIGASCLYKLVKELSTGSAALGLLNLDRQKSPIWFWLTVVADTLVVTVFLAGGIFLILGSLHVFDGYVIKLQIPR